MFVRYGSKVRLCYSPDVGEQLVNVNVIYSSCNLALTLTKYLTFLESVIR